MGVVRDGYQLLDMGSSNGVYVLGRKIQKVVIQEGDVFSIGDVHIRLLPEDLPATLAETRAAPVPGRERRGAGPGSLSARSPGEASAPPRRAPMAPGALGASSVALGLVLVLSPFILGPGTPPAAYGLALLGVLSMVAGLAFLRGLPWARTLHYGLFGLWILTCLLAPFGLAGLAYQIRGEDHPDSDVLFALVIGMAGLLAMATLIAGALLGRIYVPAPLPL